MDLGDWSGSCSENSHMVGAVSRQMPRTGALALEGGCCPGWVRGEFFVLLCVSGCHHWFRVGGTSGQQKADVSPEKGVEAGRFDGGIWPRTFNGRSPEDKKPPHPLLPQFCPCHCLSVLQVSGELPW